MIEQDLIDMGCNSTQVLKAAREVDSLLNSKLKPPRYLVQYLHEWVTRNQGQDRYGKAIC